MTKPGGTPHGLEPGQRKEGCRGLVCNSGGKGASMRFWPGGEEDELVWPFSEELCVGERESSALANTTSLQFQLVNGNRYLCRSCTDTETHTRLTLCSQQDFTKTFQIINKRDLQLVKCTLTSHVLCDTVTMTTLT